MVNTTWPGLKIPPAKRQQIAEHGGITVLPDLQSHGVPKFADMFLVETPQISG